MKKIIPSIVLALIAFGLAASPGHAEEPAVAPEAVMEVTVEAAAVPEAAPERAAVEHGYLISRHYVYVWNTWFIIETRAENCWYQVRQHGVVVWRVYECNKHTHAKFL